MLKLLECCGRSIQGETKVRLSECSYRSNGWEQFWVTKMAVIRAKEALVSTEQSKNSCALADFELQKFGSWVRSGGWSRSSHQEQVQNYAIC